MNIHSGGHFGRFISVVLKRYEGDTNIRGLDARLFLCLLLLLLAEVGCAPGEEADADDASDKIGLRWKGGDDRGALLQHLLGHHPTQPVSHPEQVELKKTKK